MLDTEFNRFLREREPINRENQRLLVSQAIHGDPERALAVIEVPDQVWQHPQAADWARAFKLILASGKEPNLVTVRDQLAAMDRADSFMPVMAVSGDGYMAQCEWDDALQSTLQFHAIRQRFHVLQKCAQELLEVTETESWDQKSLQALASVQTRKRLTTGGTAATIIKEEVERIQKGEDRKGYIDIGLPEIDEKTDGFGPGQLVIIAAHPGEGKSSFADQLAKHIAAKYGPVYFESLEMNLRELARRNISALSGAKMNLWTQEDLTTALNVADRYENLFYECAGGKLDEFLARVHRRMLLVPDTKAIFVDYLGLLQNFGKGSSDTSEASGVSDALKFIAQHYQVLVVALQQPNRNVETRQDKTPRMSDLRDSAKVGQDAHKVLFLHRPAKYEDGHSKYYVQAFILKDRQGVSGGYVELCWRPGLFRFELWSQTTYKPTVKAVYENGEATAGRYVKPEETKSRRHNPEFEDQPMTELEELNDGLKGILG